MVNRLIHYIDATTNQPIWETIRTCPFEKNAGEELRFLGKTAETSYYAIIQKITKNTDDEKEEIWVYVEKTTKPVTQNEFDINVKRFRQAQKEWQEQQAKLARQKTIAVKKAKAYVPQIKPIDLKKAMEDYYLNYYDGTSVCFIQTYLPSTTETELWNRLSAFGFEKPSDFYENPFYVLVAPDPKWIDAIKTLEPNPILFTRYL